MPADHTSPVPSLATLAARAMATLSPEARKRVEEHVTQADRLLADVFQGITTWRLRGSDDLWVRAADLAVVMEVDTTAVGKQVENGLTRGDLRPEDVRRGVKDCDLDTSIRSGAPDSITASPRGMVVLSLRGVRLLVVSCRGERGVRFRTGLDNALAFAAEAERTILALVLAETEARPAPVPPVVLPDREVQLAALAALTAGFAAGRKRMPRGLWNLAQGLPVAPAPSAPSRPAAPVLRILPDLSRPPAPSEPDWPAGFTLSATSMADGMGMGWDRVRRLLQQSGMWLDPDWHVQGHAWVATGTGALRRENRHRLRSGAPVELQRRLNPLFSSGEA